MRLRRLHCQLAYYTLLFLPAESMPNGNRSSPFPDNWWSFPLYPVVQHSGSHTAQVHPAAEELPPPFEGGRPLIIPNDSIRLARLPPSPIQSAADAHTLVNPLSWTL